MRNQRKVYLCTLQRCRWILLCLALILAVLFVFSFHQQETKPLTQNTTAQRQRDSIFILFVVITTASPIERKRRDGIRNSWKQYMTDNNAWKPTHFNRLLFFVSQYDAVHGSNMTKEIQQFDDIVPLSAMRRKSDDAYNKISKKIMRVFQWICHDSSYSPRYVVKVDTDTYVNVPAITQYLAGRRQTKFNHGSRSWFYGGKCAEGGGVVRKTGKWGDIKYVDHVQHEFMPWYAYGGGYILSGTVINEILCSHHVDDWFYTVSEDMNIGFWLQPFNVSCTKVPVSMFSSGLRFVALKKCNQNHLIRHPVKTIGQMSEIYKNHLKKKSEKLCL